MPSKRVPYVCGLFAISVLLLFAALVSSAAAQQRHIAPATPQPLNNHTMLQAPPPLGIHPPGRGNVTGYIYWDTSRTNHSPANACNGLSLFVSAAYSSGTFTPLSGQPAQFGWIAKVANFAVCGYKISNVPTDTELRVQVAINPANVFSPSIIPPAAMVVRAHNYPCTHLQQMVPTVSDLESKWSSCNNTAYDVNYALVPSNQMLGGLGHGVLQSPSPTPLGPGPVSGVAQRPVLLGHPSAIDSDPIRKTGTQATVMHPSQPSPAIGRLSPQNASAKRPVQDIRGAFLKSSLTKLKTDPAIQNPAARRQLTMFAAPPPPTTRLGMAAPPPLTNVCPPGPGPGVFNINGKHSGVTFTPDPSGNEYTISGCRFGNSSGELYLEGGFKAGQIHLLIQSWTDTAIKARLNPGLSGERDQSNVSLVIVPIGSQGLTRIKGMNFYAMRATVTLKLLPRQAVTIASVTASNGKPVTATFSSPGNMQINDNSSRNFTGVMYRSNWARFGPGMDIWDLSGLGPGFVPLQFSLTSRLFNGCTVGILPADETLYYDGTWRAAWDPKNSNRILVTFAEVHCHRSASLMQIEDDFSDSEYALNIDVVGPRGVDPWAK